MIPNMNLVRAILLNTEAKQIGPPKGFAPGEELLSHKLYLEEAGLAIVAKMAGNDTIVDAAVTALTPLGTRFVNAVRDDTNWARLNRRLNDALNHTSIGTIIELSELFQRDASTRR